MPVWDLPPGEIEARSFAIIDREAGSHAWDPAAWSVVRRMIHATGDFDYRDNARIHPRALESGKAALMSGAALVTDTGMALSGISRARLDKLGAGSADCLITHPRTLELAAAKGGTRAAAAVEASLELLNPQIFVIGNAPTALFRLLELAEAGRVSPALVVGVPVGFVNAAESKDALAATDIPYITSLGRKGGSNVAAAVINALAQLCLEDMDRVSR